MSNDGAAFPVNRPRYFVVESRGSGRCTEIVPANWDSPHIPDWRYYGRVFLEMERHLDIPNLRFYITWDTEGLPEYGPNVVVLLLGEEIGRVPSYALHVAAVLKTMSSFPFLGIRRWVPFDRVRLALVIKHCRNLALYALSRLKALVGIPRIPARRVLEQPHLLHTPLGCYAIEDVPIKPIKDRPYHAFFAGNVQSGPRDRPGFLASPKGFARNSMMHEAISLAKRNPAFKFDHLVTDNASQPAASEQRSYSQRMMDSKICLAPRGSVAETWRFFEGLKCGCLVVCEPLPERDYYRNAPIIQIDHWSELERVIKPFLQDDDALEASSKRSLQYWNDVCGENAIGRRIAEFIRKSPALQQAPLSRPAAAPLKRVTF